MALELDARRRAMLQEMGIAVWMPEAAAPSAGASAAKAPAAAADPRAVRAPAAGERAAAPGPADGARPPGPDASGAAGWPPAAAPGDPRAEPPVPSAAPRAGSGAAGPSSAAAPSAPAPASAAAGRGDPAQPAAFAPSRGPAAGAQPAAARRPGEGPAVSLGDWQLLHDGAPRAAAGPGPEGSAPDAPAAPEPRAPQEPRTWLLLTESSTPADLCAAQDPAGRLLAAMLRAVQYGGPVRVVGAPVRPAAPAGAEGAAAPGAGAGLADGLEEAVARHRPVLVLALGRLASQAVLGTREPLGRLRGRLHAGPVAGVPVVATYDAGYLLRAPADKARAWADLCLGLEQLRVPPAS
ncbi:MAG: hypothetical protein PGN26_00545 [Xylophilus ampelinus]